MRNQSHSEHTERIEGGEPTASPERGQSKLEGVLRSERGEQAGSQLPRDSLANATGDVSDLRNVSDLDSLLNNVSDSRNVRHECREDYGHRCPDPVRAHNAIWLEVTTLFLVALAISVWVIHPVEDRLPLHSPAVGDGQSASRSADRASSMHRTVDTARWDAETSTWELSYADDRILKQLAHKDVLRALLVEDAQVTHAGLQALLDCPQLEHLRMRHARVDDVDIELLCRLPRLRMLNLPHAVFSDQSLRRLARLPALEMLRFSSPHVTDEGIAALADAPQLRFLHIIDCPISDRSLLALASCAHLESLYIDGASLSDDAIVTLFERRPSLHLHLDQKHHDRDPQRLHDSGPASGTGKLLHW
jgi:hypothetical protein